LGLVKIVEVRTPTPLVPGAYLTGRVERVTDYEKIPATFLAKKGDEYVQEEFIGEQAVVMNAKGKGLIVLSACAHRGIVNTLKHAQKMTGIEKVHAVIGGFHLTGAKPEVIEKTIADVKAMRPNYIVPTHCTGFEAITAFAREMPDQFILNTAGTRYVIEGQADAGFGTIAVIPHTPIEVIYKEEQAPELSRSLLPLTRPVRPDAFGLLRARARSQPNLP
jgi:7,8-dihydropterin-6-yl-methyl-4-(beta-D-ribofuranosyl)aminobenzene 5'-phosphate synthase